MLDRVTATIELETPDPARWREQFHALLRRIYRVLIEHPGIAAIAQADLPTTDAVLRLVENLLSIVLAGGVRGQDAAWACDISMLVVTAVAREDELRDPTGTGDVGRFQRRVDEVYRTFATLPPDRFPSLATHAAEMVTGDSDDRFRFAVAVIIEGLVARGSSSTAP
jgi:hypothetical protein